VTSASLVLFENWLLHRCVHVLQERHKFSCYETANASEDPSIESDDRLADVLAVESCLKWRTKAEKTAEFHL
jgi:hypothetical protein